MTKTSKNKPSPSSIGCEFESHPTHFNSVKRGTGSKPVANAGHFALCYVLAFLLGAVVAAGSFALAIGGRTPDPDIIFLIGVTFCSGLLCGWLWRLEQPDEDELKAIEEELAAARRKVDLARQELEAVEGRR